MDIVAFCEQIRTPELSIEFLRERGILKRIPPRCSDCRGPMTEVKDVSFSDGYVWRCPKHKGRKKTIRTGPFIENANFELKKFVELAYFWSLSISSASMEILCQLSAHTIIDYNNFFRDVCSRWLIQNPIRLGGVGHIVQIGYFSSSQ